MSHSLTLHGSLGFILVPCLRRTQDRTKLQIGTSQSICFPVLLAGGLSGLQVWVLSTQAWRQGLWQVHNTSKKSQPLRESEEKPQQEEAGLKLVLS